MFKFSKYFFIVFLFITMLPLSLMFLWNDYQIRQVSIKRKAEFIDMNYKQLEFSSKDYLKTKENQVKRTINTIPLNKMSLNLKQYRNIFDVEEVFLITSKYKIKSKSPIPKVLNKLNLKKFSQITSYYELITDPVSKKQEIKSITIVPPRNTSNKGFILIDKVNFDNFHMFGPISLEIYATDNIQKNNLIQVVEDPFLLKNKMEMKKPNKLFIIQNKLIDLFIKQNDLNTNFKVLKLKNNSDKTIATIILRDGFQHLFFQKHTNDSKHRPDFSGDNNCPPPPFEHDHHGPNFPDEHNSHLPPFGHNPHPPMMHNFHPMHNEYNNAEQEFSLIILITGILLSLFVSVYIKKNFINPFLLISTASKKIQKGDLEVKVNCKVNQAEVTETINRFNEMIEDLKEKKEIRNSFITNLTHDLKTPLIAQERAIELIAQEFENLGLEEQLQLTKSIDKNNKHLLRMVNLILDTYRFDSSTIQLKLSKVDLYALINQCFDQLKTLASEKNISLINNLTENFPLIEADNSLIKRVFLNLIVNAIENISKNCIVKIEGNNINNYINIIVEDNGSGISPEDIPHIFDQYYTGKSDERKIGSGLGLYVCKQLIALHNGEITVESKQNQYTKFIIKLPIQLNLSKGK